MSKRRVGTLSMAILLIVSGITMLIAQFYKFSAVATAIRWYPIIPILLGGEILWYVYSSKDEKTKIQYDIFSIFIICIMVLFSFAFYGLLEIDLFSKLNKMISSQEYILKTPYEKLTIDDTINKIIIDAPKSCKLIVRTNHDNNIIASSTSSVTADSRETAQKLLTTQNIHTYPVGDILHVSFDGDISRNNMTHHAQTLDYTLIIPGNKQVEINNGNDIELLIGSFESTWLIDKCECTNIRLSQNTDIKVKAFVDSAADLGGNIEWKIDDKTNHAQEVSVQETSENLPYNVKGEFSQKDGNHQILVLNNHQVTINDLSL